MIRCYCCRFLFNMHHIEHWTLDTKFDINSGLRICSKNIHFKISNSDWFLIEWLFVVLIYEIHTNAKHVQCSMHQMRASIKYARFFLSIDFRRYTFQFRIQNIQLLIIIESKIISPVRIHSNDLESGMFVQMFFNTLIKYINCIDVLRNDISCALVNKFAKSEIDDNNNKFHSEYHFNRLTGVQSPTAKS